MSMVQTIVKRPTTIFILFALLIGLGIYSATDLAVDLYPEIEPPVLVVYTQYTGAGPEEVERSVTRLLEGSLSNVSNVERISSVSSPGNSLIIMEFTWGTDMADASNSIRDNLEYIKGFMTAGAETPMIFKFDPSMIPIMGLSVTGNRTAEELREIAENIIQPRIEQVEGVSLAGVQGGRERIIRVEIPQNRLEAYNLTMSQVAGMLRGQNVQMSAGRITEGNIDYLVQTSGEYSSIEQIKETVISYRGGPSPSDPFAPTRTVRLRDIADVYDGYKDPADLVYINGEPGVMIIVQKQSGTNSVQTAENVRQRVDRIKSEVPQGIDVVEIFNTTDIIRSSINQVASSAILGAIFAVLILFVFLRSLKSTFIIGLTIPISLVVTLMLMYFAGLTLNVMTLAGLALGIGMLVDNSIVILENIYRYREKGAKLTASAILGTQEMITAIVASTLTTICVFAPIALFRSQLDIVGELFSGLSFTVVISLTASLAVAIMLIPVLASHYLPLTSRKQRPLTGVLAKIDLVMERFFSGLDSGYRRTLAFVLRHKLITIFVILAIFGGSLTLIPRAGFVFMPSMQSDNVTVSVEMPIGTHLDTTEEVLRQMELLVEREIRGYERTIMRVGERGLFGLGGAAGGHKGSLQIVLPDFDRRIDTADDIMTILRSHFNDFPGAVFSFGGGGMGMGMGGTSPIDIVIRSEDLDLGKAIAEDIRNLIANNIPEATEPTVNLQDGLPQVEIMLDRDRLYALGLNAAAVGQEIRANLDGVNASRFRTGGSEYDILVILSEKDRSELPDLEKIFVLNAAGQRIPLSSFARYEKTTGPVDINRENQMRTIHVTAGTVPGTPLNEIERKVRDLITREIPTDDDVIIEFSGDYQDLIKYGTRFIYIMIVSIFLVFGVMASQFESFLDPFIIFFTIPLSLIGVIFIYVFTGETFNIFTAVGLVMLVGIIVNNGIVLVDYTNLLRKRGRSITEACIEAGGNRLRPILMTTLTTILGLVPMAFFPGEGSELVRPIGKTVVGGLSVGAVLTLFLIPVLYAILNRISERSAERRQRRKAARRTRRKELAAAEKEAAVQKKAEKPAGINGLTKTERSL